MWKPSRIALKGSSFEAGTVLVLVGVAVWFGLTLARVFDIFIASLAALDTILAG